MLDSFCSLAWFAVNEKCKRCDTQSSEWKMKYYEMTFKVISSPAQTDNANEMKKPKLFRCSFNLVVIANASMLLLLLPLDRCLIYSLPSCKLFILVMYSRQVDLITLYWTALFPTGFEKLIWSTKRLCFEHMQCWDHLQSLFIFRQNIWWNFF